MSPSFDVPFGGRGGGYTEEELDLVREVAAAPLPLTQGPRLRQFEDDFLRFQDAGGYAFAVSSCTAALEITAELLRPLPGSEIVIPTHTFTASAYPFLKRGLRPIWADSCPISGVVGPEQVKPLLGPDTKAVLVPHLYGYVADVPGIQALAKEYGVPVIEDAAQSIGARLQGRRSGSLADFGVFSFHSHKNLTTLGEGGMLWVKASTSARLVPLLRHNGHCPYDYDRPDYWIPAMGNVDLPAMDGVDLSPANYCLGEVQAALGSALLERIDEVNDLKRRRALQFINALGDNPLLAFHVEDSERHNYHLLAAKVENGLRDAFIRRMAGTHRIQCVVQYQPLHRYDYYRKLGFGEAGAPDAEAFYDNMVSFPFHHSLTEDDLGQTLDATKETLKWLTG